MMLLNFAAVNGFLKAYMLKYVTKTASEALAKNNNSSLLYFFCIYVRSIETRKGLLLTAYSKAASISSNKNPFFISLSNSKLS